MHMVDHLKFLIAPQSALPKITVEMEYKGNEDYDLVVTDPTSTHIVAKGKITVMPSGVHMHEIEVAETHRRRYYAAALVFWLHQEYPSEKIVPVVTNMADSYVRAFWKTMRDSKLLTGFIKSDITPTDYKREMKRYGL